MLKTQGLWILALSLAGCASVPEVEYRYYGAKATTGVSVTQSITCTRDQLAVVVANSTVGLATAYSSDPTKVYVLRSKDLSSPFADGETKLEW